MSLQPEPVPTPVPDPGGQGIAPAAGTSPAPGWRRTVRRFVRHRLATLGAAVVVLLGLVALLAPVLAPYDPEEPDYGAVLQPPSVAHPLGTDELGRDILSRLIYGARVSLLAGLISVGLALAIGLPIGLVAGYFRGFWDEWVIMRLTDALMAFPSLVLALAIAAVLGPSFGNAMIAIGISLAPTFIRLVRGQVLAVRELEYVEAGRAAGAGHLWQIGRHILPNILSPVLVQATLSLASAVISEASLSYLGLGTQPPNPSWGYDLRTAQGYLAVAPWMAYWPGLAIFVTVLAFNLLGDGLRDLFDPRLRT
ncbi:ABC transporter permease [Thermaerobacter composti]|uniref:ABC transporter permease n=1 Tax=Thermaerobacter composti TaxID=554949 RepID=A0ABZ0QMG2_9FIRM|nr:ABC transporter permease [Thermaerobacter composti]WPD18233.1 ABC transporter permease [Thermaerobacter composti]